MNTHNNSVDLITTAQAFHWFDVGKFKSECKRIVKENGKISLIWNVRDMLAPINNELYEIYRKYCPGFIGFSGGIIKDDPRIKEVFERYCKQGRVIIPNSSVAYIGNL